MNDIPIWELSPRDHRICSYCLREFPTITDKCKHERDCPAWKEHLAGVRVQAAEWFKWAHEHRGELR